jgi:hypothetical protein
MRSIGQFLRRIWDDILNFRNVDAYVVAFLGIIMVVLGVLNPPDPSIYLLVVTAGMVVLLFRETTPPSKEVDLDSVLHTRQTYKPLREFLQGAKTVWICGPSNYNVLRDASLQREVLEHGGAVRVLLQDREASASMEILHQQLDPTSDLDHDIRGSLLLLDKMRANNSKAEYKLLPYNPGFSMLIVNPTSGDGYLTVEFFGFHNNLIDERMHIVIERRSSQYWFEYWTKQYQTMWDASKIPTQ